MLILILLTLTVALATPITVIPDKSVYNVGDSVSITGTATPNAYVTIQLYDAQGLRKAIAQTRATSEGIYSKTNLYTFTWIDKPGGWKVSVFDSVTQESSEAAFTLSAPTPPVLSLIITPDKAEYRAESITITVAANQPIQNVILHITQNNTQPLRVTTEPTVGDKSRWSGTYNIIEGYDGTAKIDVTAKDIYGSTVEAKTTFTVDSVPPKVTISATSKTEVATITVTGTVDDPTISSIQLSVVPATQMKVPIANQRWSQEVTLTSTGTNTIIATAIDAAGNEGKASTVVIYVGALEVLLGKVEQLSENISTLDQKTKDIEVLSGKVESLNEALNDKLSNATLLITIALILSLVAASAAVYVMVTIRRTIVLK